MTVNISWNNPQDNIYRPQNDVNHPNQPYTSSDFTPAEHV